MNYPVYFHNDVTDFQWSKESHSMDSTGQRDNLENADHESLWEEQLDSGILCRDQGKGETLGPVLKVYENRDVGNVDVNCYCRSNKAWNNFHTPTPDNSLVFIPVNRR